MLYPLSYRGWAASHQRAAEPHDTGPKVHPSDSGTPIHSTATNTTSGRAPHA